MKSLLLLILNLGLIPMAFGQEKENCNKLLSTEIVTDSAQDNYKTIKSNLYKLTKCGLDSVDVQIFATPAELGYFLVKSMNQKPTYQDLYNKIMAFKETAQYDTIVKWFKVTTSLIHHKASLKNWQKDHILLKSVMPPSALAKDTLKYIFNKPNNYTFKHLLGLSKENKKLLILFFTAFGSVIRDRIEHNIFAKKTIVQKLKKNFILIYLYCDDRKKLPKAQWYKNKAGELVKTVGEKYCDWERNKYHTKFQPYFIMLDKNGKALKELDYHLNLEKFKNFLDINTKF